MLSACAGKTQYRSACAQEIDAAWSEQDIHVGSLWRHDALDVGSSYDQTLTITIPNVPAKPDIPDTGSRLIIDQVLTMDKLITIIPLSPPLSLTTRRERRHDHYSCRPTKPPSQWSYESPTDSIDTRPAAAGSALTMSPTHTAGRGGLLSSGEPYLLALHRPHVLPLRVKDRTQKSGLSSSRCESVSLLPC